MTDKQIIIDGVDVNDYHNRTFYKNDEGDVQCKCYRFEDADSDTLLFGICKQHPHCYYKQLKRKEQECERLKEEALHSDYGIMKNNLEGAITYLEKENKDLSKIIDCKNGTVLSLKQQLNQLKAENEELKEELRQKKMTILMNNDHYFEVDQENKKLKQTLTEIKEIAEHCINQDICTFCDYSDKCYIEDEEIPTYDVCKLILQKISEVEDV